MFSDALPLDCRAPLRLFRPYVQSGRFAMEIDVFVLRPNFRLRFVYYARRGRAWRIRRLRVLNRRLLDGGARWTDEDDAETGRLLGYSERDIATFLTHKRRLTPGR